MARRAEPRRETRVERSAVKRSLLATIALLVALRVPGSGFQVPVQVPSSARAIVSRADRIYTTPVSRSEEGIPIGNGRMGALVWTTPRAMKFQINRLDSELIDIELAGVGADVFAAGGTNLRLSVYEGLLDVKAAGIHARILAWHERDVIAIEVDDRRPVPEPIQINVAASQIASRDGRILLTPNFQEGGDRAKSAVAIALLGRKTLTRVADETARIVSPGERGRVVILIASAATLDAEQDVAAAALGNLDAAAAKSFDDLAGDTAEWWHDFWQHNTIALNGADGTANQAADKYHYYQYLVAVKGTAADIRYRDR